MIAFATAVLIASLLGSMHCVGMCGPLALWATGGGKRRTPIITYHLGRLTTYLSAGLAAGVLGSAITIGGDLAGLQSLAARVAGGLLIVVGLLRLLQMLPSFQRRSTKSLSPSRVAGWLQQAKPLIATRGPAGRAYLAGLLTTWLPCGWLYLFILVAGGSGGVLPALVVMSAFWLGTLPALTALVLGARSLLPRTTAVIPIAASALLIVSGIYTATGRASADLSGMLPPQEFSADTSATSLVHLTEQSLPCCLEDESVAAP